MRLGVLLGLAESSFETLATVAREAEAAGISSIYVVEGGPHSASINAAVAIQATQAVRVSTYVVNAYAREPWLTGMVARDLSHLSNGRFALGVGTGNLHWNDWFMGRDSSKPLAKMRDYIAIVRAMVAAKPGEPIEYEGKVHRIRWEAPREPSCPPIPVYLSASGPKMVRLAGEVSDGVGVGILASTAFLRDVVRPNALAGAESAGRDPDALAFPTGAVISIHRDSELARDTARARICSLYHPLPHPYYDSQLRQMGFEEFADQAAKLMPLGRRREARALVPDEVIDTMTITGTPKECAARIAEYEGLADEMVLGRLSQRGEPPGVKAYEDVFELASMVGES